MYASPLRQADADRWKEPFDTERQMPLSFNYSLGNSDHRDDKVYISFCINFCGNGNGHHHDKALRICKYKIGVEYLGLVCRLLWDLQTISKRLRRYPQCRHPGLFLLTLPSSFASGKTCLIFLSRMLFFLSPGILQSKMAQI